MGRPGFTLITVTLRHKRGLKSCLNIALQGPAVPAGKFIVSPSSVFLSRVMNERSMGLSTSKDYKALVLAAENGQK